MASPFESGIQATAIEDTNSKARLETRREPSQAMPHLILKSYYDLAARTGLQLPV